MGINQIFAAVVGVVGWFSIAAGIVTLLVTSSQKLEKDPDGMELALAASGFVLSFVLAIGMLIGTAAWFGT